MFRALNVACVIISFQRHARNSASLEKEVGHLRRFSKRLRRSVFVRTFLREVASAGRKELYGKGVAMCSGRSQGRWSGSVLENSSFVYLLFRLLLFPRDTALTCSGDSGLEEKSEEAGQRTALAATGPCYESQAWRAVGWVCCSDGCCAVQAVNCIESPPLPRLAITAGIACCVYVTVKPIRGTTCPLICETACLASVGA